jgi:hypothetical protein
MAIAETMNRRLVNILVLLKESAAVNGRISP